MKAIELRIDPSPLTQDEQALLFAFLDLLSSGAVELVAQRLQVLYHWERAPVHRRALALKLMDDRLPSKMVARICGLSDRQLRRYPEYRLFARLLSHGRGELPRGRVGSDGGVEAWSE